MIGLVGGSGRDGKRSPNVEELEMKRVPILFLTILVAGPGPCRGQVSGNVAYSQPGGRAKAEQGERSRRVLTRHELPPTGTSMFVEASVLMNVRADEYVAVFVEASVLMNVRADEYVAVF